MIDQRVFLYTLDPTFPLSKLSELGSGLRLTLTIASIGIGGSLLVGVVGGAVRAVSLPVASPAIGYYVELFRNTPLVVQIFLLYFGLPQLHITLDATTVGWLSLLLWGGAYNVENFRAGFEAVNRDYQEAARALGLTAWTTFLFVTVPIGSRTAVPSVTNTCISVLKNSSYMIAISLPELTTTTINIVATTFRVFEMFAMLAVVYLALIWSLSAAMSVLERRLALPQGA